MWGDQLRTLYHFPLDPNCRAVRMMMGEKRLDVTLSAVDQSTELPILTEENGEQIPYAAVIAEYLNEAYPEPDLMGYEPLLRVDVRRISQYFLAEINKSVTQPLLQRAMYGPLRGTIASPQAVANAEEQLHGFFEFIELLDGNNNWLAGPSFSCADVYAAAHISTLDYIGQIDWNSHLQVQRWYRRIKSRRCMNSVLADRVEGLEPPAHYDDPDF